MNLIVDIIVLILKFLIRVGDITLAAINFFANLIKKVSKRKRGESSIKAKYFIIGSLFSLICIFFPLLFIIFVQELPSPKQLSFQQAPLTTKIFDRDGALLYQIYANQNRTLVPLSSVPVHLQHATIAIEDKNFYQNAGFDILAIIRAGIADISGKPLQGGSTITQQLIKSTLLTPEISIKRKVKEIILAFWAEKIYTKDQILEMYFNQVPYGGTAWGVEAAAQVYFGKPIKNLNLSESAFLAGLTRAPSLYSPFGEFSKLWKKRQEEVLTRMVELKYISTTQKEKALKEELEFSKPGVPIHAPHFVMYVRDLLVKKYGLGMVEKGGLKVVTSIDLKIQEEVQKIVTSEVEKNAYLNLTNGASLVTNPKNGDILAMVGSKDYSDETIGNFNVVTALRQPGSSIKVITYSAALDKGFTPATLIDDLPITFKSANAPSYSPVNYDGKFHGTITLRNALGNSINIPAVKILSKIGVPTMIDLAKKMGITTWGNSDKYGLAITLGAADVKMTDMATVYGVFANDGYRVDLNPFVKITDSQNNVLEEKTDPTAGGERKVIDEGIAFIVSNILADNRAREMEFGSNSPLFIPNHTVSVKTGTSDNKRDNWTIGYTKDFVVAVWVGNNDNSPMSQYLASGITGAAPIWRNIMLKLISNSKDVKISMPPNVVEKKCLGRKEYFIKGTERLVNCNFIPKPTSTITQN